MPRWPSGCHLARPRGNPLPSCAPLLELLREISSSLVFPDMGCALQGHEDLGTELVGSKCDHTCYSHDGD